jgi:hypothetical protein
VLNYLGSRPKLLPFVRQALIQVSLLNDLSWLVLCRYDMCLCFYSWHIVVGQNNKTKLVWSRKRWVCVPQDDRWNKRIPKGLFCKATSQGLGTNLYYMINDLDSQLMYLGLHRILDYWCTDFVYNSEWNEPGKLSNKNLLNFQPQWTFQFVLWAFSVWDFSQIAYTTEKYFVTSFRLVLVVLWLSIEK